jgi:hypothetical protein
MTRLITFRTATSTIRQVFKPEEKDQNQQDRAIHQGQGGQAEGQNINLKDKTKTRIKDKKGSQKDRANNRRTCALCRVKVQQ